MLFELQVTVTVWLVIYVVTPMLSLIWQITNIATGLLIAGMFLCIYAHGTHVSLMFNTVAEVFLPHTCSSASPLRPTRNWAECGVSVRSQRTEGLFKQRLGHEASIFKTTKAILYQSQRQCSWNRSRLKSSTKRHNCFCEYSYIRGGGGTMLQAGR
jgi:hypothetical protein